MAKTQNKKKLVVIPAYKVADTVVEITERAISFSDHVLIVDDACPEGSGQKAQRHFSGNKKVSVMFHELNKGVGGAMKTGYFWALEHDFAIVVKIDGDGQIHPELIPDLIEPILGGRADYAKGNRFGSPRTVGNMPFVRLIGNGFLSLLTKLSSGYWSINDPTNGFVGISREMLQRIEPRYLADDYFFESDLLYRLSIARARVAELTMESVYSNEKSSLNIPRVVFTFPLLHLRNMIKRIFYNYYVRDWSIGSIELPTGITLLVAGLWFGLISFQEAQQSGGGISAGEAVGSSVAIILGFQLLLSFVSHDIQSERRADHRI